MAKECVLYDRACICCGECNKCDLDENKICNDCGECDKCDLDPGKVCDNCGKCIGLDADSRAIEIEDVILKN